MELSYIQKRFSKIYIIVSIVWYLNIMLSILLVVTFAITVFFPDLIIWLINNSNSMPPEKVSQVLQIIQNSPEIIYINFTNLLLQGLFELWYLYYMRHVVVCVKGGEIFSEKNFSNVKKIFIIYMASYVFMLLSPAILDTIRLFLYWEVSQGMPSSTNSHLPTSLLFLWFLYEIFKVSFYYKKENDTLKEEASLTI